MRKTAVVCLLSFFLSLTPTHAADQNPLEDAITGVFDLGSILLGGKRLSSPFQEFVSSNSSSTSVVTRQDIELSGARNVSEALEDVPGVAISDLSGNGEEPTLDFRGFNQGRDVVYTLDGVRLNEPKSNNINFPLIPTSMLDRLDISRGGASFLYGEGALGGVANLVTPVPLRGFHGRLHTRVGSFGEWGESFDISDSRDGHAVYVSGDINYEQGFRENTAVRKEDLYAKYLLDPTDTSQLIFSYLYADAELGRSGSIRESYLRARGPEATERPRNFTELDTNLITEQFQIKPADTLALTQNAFFRRSDELSVANFATFDTFDNELDLNMDSWGFTLQGEHSKDLLWGLSDNLLLGMEYVSNEIDEEDFNRSKATLQRLGTVVESQSSKEAIGFFSKISMDWSDRVGAYYGVRYDAIDFENEDRINIGNNIPSEVTKTSHSIGMSYQAMEHLALTGAYSRSFRAPTLSDLYANPLFGGNPALKPEETTDYEAGLKWEDDRLTAKSTLYFNERTNEIGFDPNLTDSTHLFGRNNNFGKTERSGVESSLEYRFRSWMRYRASHTYTEALFASDTADGKKISGAHIPMVPRNRFTSSILWQPAKDLNVDLRMMTVSKQVLTNDITNERNGRRLPAYTVFDLRTSYRWKGWILSFEIRNLLDEDYESAGSLGAAFSSFNSDHTVEDNFFVPAPGRSYGAAAGYAW